MPDLEWTWEEAHRYKGDGNWEINAQIGNGDDYGFSVSLSDDGQVSFTGWLPPGSGLGGIAIMAGEALSRINRAQNPGATTGSSGG